MITIPQRVLPNSANIVETSNLNAMVTRRYIDIISTVSSIQQTIDALLHLWEQLGYFVGNSRLMREADSIHGEINRFIFEKHRILSVVHLFGCCPKAKALSRSRFDRIRPQWQAGVCRTMQSK